MDTVHTISIMLGASWAAGINLYATVLALGWMGVTGQIDLPPELEILQNPLVLGAAGLMYAIEFFADKVPGVDSAWDTLHTFIRIPAGAVLAAGAAQGLDVGPAAEFAALLVGGTLATASHATKAGSRALINTSPEPFSNWTASVAEDISVFAGMWAALHHPWLFIAALVVFILIVAWLLPKIWRTLKRLFAALGRMLGGGSAQPAPVSGATTATPPPPGAPPGEGPGAPPTPLPGPRDEP